MLTYHRFAVPGGAHAEIRASAGSHVLRMPRTSSKHLDHVVAAAFTVRCNRPSESRSVTNLRRARARVAAVLFRLGA